MGWELRDGKPYYYRRVRRKGKQVRRYVGSGPLANIASAADLALNRQRELTRAKRRQDQERWRAADAALQPLMRCADMLLRASLAKAGFHQHGRSEWRRRRVPMGEIAMTLEINAPGPFTGEVVEARDLMRRASAGDRSVLPALAALLDSHPEGWTHAGDLAAQALQAWISLVAGGDLLLRDSLGRKLEAMRQELLTTSASPLERVLVGRVIACHLQVEYADALAAQNRSTSPSVVRLLLERQDSSQRRLLAAAKALALCRRLLPEEAPVRPPRLVSDAPAAPAPAVRQEAG